MCFRVKSRRRNASCAGQYGPHGELYFFLIQKEPAIAPNSETFSSFFDADIRLPVSLLLSSRRSARLPCT